MDPGYIPAYVKASNCPARLNPPRAQGQDGRVSFWNQLSHKYEAVGLEISQIFVIVFVSLTSRVGFLHRGKNPENRIAKPCHDSNMFRNEDMNRLKFMIPYMPSASQSGMNR